MKMVLEIGDCSTMYSTVIVIIKVVLYCSSDDNGVGYCTAVIVMM
mgnify:CR=1 FL=1